MTPDRYKRIRELFDVVIEAEPGKRHQLLEELCGEDTRLRGEVQALVAIYEEDPDFLETQRPPASTQDDSETTGPPDIGPGDQVGNYTIIERLGAGAFAEVFLARQLEPATKMVALKILHPGKEPGRMKGELQTLSVMSHPNLAHVLGFGETRDGRPYLVMEYVRGEPITDYWDRKQLTIRERLGIFLQLCDAVQHAHHKAIIHRDIKPANILVTDTDDQPLVKLVDFGVAKQLGPADVVLTPVGRTAGTPEFTSPEQYEISKDVDTRSDIYAMGVVLYLLLTGELPFERHDDSEAAYVALVQRKCREDPPLPSLRAKEMLDGAPVLRHRRTGRKSLISELRGNLDCIVMKAMSRERSLRYATVSDLAREINRHLSGDTAEAASAYTIYRISRLLQKYRLVVDLIILMALGFTVSLATLGWLVGGPSGPARLATVLVSVLLATMVLPVLSYFVWLIYRGRFSFLNAIVSLAFVVVVAAWPVRVGLSPREKPGEVGSQTALAVLDLVDLTGDLWLDVVVRESPFPPASGVELAYVYLHAWGDPRFNPLALELMERLDKRLAEGESLIRDAVELYEQNAGELHADTLRAKSALAKILLAQGKLDEAEATSAAVFEGHRALLGEKHAETLQAAALVVHVALTRQDLGKAESMLRWALERRREVLGEHHLETLGTAEWLAAVLIKQEMYAEAEPILVSALEGYRRALGDGDDRVLALSDVLQTLRPLASDGAPAPGPGNRPR